MAGFLGLRWGELIGLHRRDTDLEQGTLRVRRAVAELGADGRVFIGAKGATPRQNHFNPLWHKACRKAGIKGLHFHDLRHTGNSLAASTGASTRELMARMGHSTARAALIYQHASADRNRLIADALSKLVLHSVSVAGAVLREDGRLLAIRRADEGTWELPGGVLELTESPEAGVRREVLEETGIEVEIDTLTGVYENTHPRHRRPGLPLRALRRHRTYVRRVDRGDLADPGRGSGRMSEVYAIRLLDALDEEGPHIRSHQLPPQPLPAGSRDAPAILEPEAPAGGMSVSDGTAGLWGSTHALGLSRLTAQAWGQSAIGLYAMARSTTFSALSAGSKSQYM
ncbi:NUDIX domain-containing protein [Streptomyces sp. NBC_00597]|uniref:NUDIX domain-containing protein n=1 Tax=unclassified Streptomyces TaxID=2593676 RepID=UPI0030DFA26C